ncbi:hypothetical protein RI367_003152 [Sorochytrium milnesiophthora]
MSITAPAVVIGGGVVGLAVALRLARYGVVLLDREGRLAVHQSSRNSEVIHAGLYYPHNSFKTRLCVRGKQLLYDFAERYSVPHKRVGKWIFATDAAGQTYLEALLRHAHSIAVPLEKVPIERMRQEQPNLIATMALSSPTTGIIDTQRYVQVMERLLADADVPVLLRSDVTHARWDTSRKHCTLRVSCSGDNSTPSYNITTPVVINAAGIGADLTFRSLCTAAGVPFPASEHTVYPMRGHYFRLRNPSKHNIRRLLYPVPEANLAGLGIHATVDLDGGVRFGPDTSLAPVASTEAPLTERYRYGLESPELEQQLQTKFHRAVSTYLHGIAPDDLAFSYTGIRARITPPGQPARDFCIADESARGFPGWVNCLGIESPGLTSSLAIAEYVERLVSERLQTE